MQKRVVDDPGTPRTISHRPPQPGKSAYYFKHSLSASRLLHVMLLTMLTSPSNRCTPADSTYNCPRVRSCRQPSLHCGRLRRGAFTGPSSGVLSTATRHANNANATGKPRTRASPDAVSRPHCKHEVSATPNVEISRSILTVFFAVIGYFRASMRLSLTVL